MTDTGGPVIPATDNNGARDEGGRPLSPGPVGTPDATGRLTVSDGPTPRRINIIMIEVLIAFFAGCLGGALPPLAKLSSAMLNQTGLHPIAAVELIGMAQVFGVFALMGGIVAVGIGRESLKTAMTVGIAAPAIISSYQSGAAGVDNPTLHDSPAVKSQQAPNRTGWLISQVFAQDLPNAGAQRELRAVTITPRPGNFDLRPSSFVHVCANVLDGATTKQDCLGTIDPRQPIDIQIPANTSSLTLGTGEVSATVDLPSPQTGTQSNAPIQSAVPPAAAPPVTIETTFSTHPTVKDGWNWALGGARTSTIDNLQARIVPPEQ